MGLISEIEEEMINNNIFLNDLPTGGLNRGKRINWEESIGYKVKGIYENIKFEVEIVDYKTKGQYLWIKYLDEKPFRITTSGFMQCRLGKLMGVFTNEFKIELGESFKDDKRDLIITDRKYKIDKKGISRKWYKYKCNKCGWIKGEIEESNFKKGYGCSCCANITPVLGINTIWDTDRWMCDLGVSVNDAKSYTKCSNKKITIICPDCGEIKAECITLNNIYRTQSIGCACGDGLSYPEKIMYSVLKQLDINFITQLNKTTFKWCKNYKYDFYIVDIGIIETHGSQHYKEKGRNGSRSLMEEQENDEIKEELANSNDIKEYIIIDCSKSELHFIKNNIIGSILSELYNLNIIDWNEAEEFALTNLVKTACKIKKNNPNISTVDIGKMINSTKSTIQRYLKQGTKLGWCEYNPKESSKNNKVRCKQVEIFKDNNSLGIFYSVRELTRQSLKLFGVKLQNGSISKVCSGKQEQYHGYTFKYVEDNNIIV